MGVSPRIQQTKPSGCLHCSHQPSRKQMLMLALLMMGTKHYGCLHRSHQLFCKQTRMLSSLRRAQTKLANRLRAGLRSGHHKMESQRSSLPLETAVRITADASGKIHGRIIAEDDLIVLLDPRCFSSFRMSLENSVDGIGASLVSAFSSIHDTSQASL